LNSILTVLTQNILPIFIVAALGFGLQRWKRLDKRTLSSLVLNCLSPCLVFSSLVNSQLPGEELFELSAFTLLTILAMGLLGLLLARVTHLSRSDTVAFLIVVMFVNGGNYGLTLNQLRYGDAGLARAIVYFTTSALVIYTLGLYIASMGQMTWRDAGAKLLRLPPVYAAVAAVMVYSLSIDIPDPLMVGIQVAGAGAIPVMIILLGMQLADWRGFSALRLAVPAVIMRLLIGPLVGVLAATVLGLQGLSRATSIVESSMPTAVFAIVLATEFDLQPTAVTSIVLLTTLLSPLTVAATITLFGL
jgi:predicted permease